MSAGRYFIRSVLWVVFGFVCLAQAWFVSVQLHGSSSIFEFYRSSYGLNIKIWAYLTFAVTVISSVFAIRTVFRRMDLTSGLIWCSGLVLLQFFLAIRLSASLMRFVIGG